VEIRKTEDIDEIENIVQKAMVCRIGLVDVDAPYVVPVCFGYERGKLYFHGSPKGRKVDLIKKNAKTCFEMEVDVELVGADDPCDWAMKFRSVIGFGKACILEDDEEKSHSLNVIMNHYAKKGFNFPKPSLDGVLVVRIDISQITGKQIRDEKD